MPKSEKANQAGIADAVNSDQEHIENQEKTTQKAKVKKTPKKTEEKKGRGRPKTGKSKTEGIKLGTHVKSILILPVKVHQELQVEAVRDRGRDMSDIITEILTERYNLNNNDD